MSDDDDNDYDDDDTVKRAPRSAANASRVALTIVL